MFLMINFYMLDCVLEISYWNFKINIYFFFYVDNVVKVILLNK